MILYLLVRNHLLSSYDADSTDSADSQNKPSDTDSQMNKGEFKILNFKWHHENKILFFSVQNVKSIRPSRNKPQQHVKHPTPGPIDPGSLRLYFMN